LKSNDFVGYGFSAPRITPGIAIIDVQILALVVTKLAHPL
jgi:hypothetical protein